MDFGLTAQVGALLPQMTYDLPYIGVFDLRPYAIALILFVILTVLFKVIQYGIVVRLKRLSEKTHTDMDDVIIVAIQGIRAWVYTIVALYIAIQAFAVPEIVGQITTFIFLFAIVWQAIEIIARFVDYFAIRVLEKDEDGDGITDPNAATASHMLTLFARIILWTLGVLFVLSNLGIEVTSLIAGLGIGGVAIAFALQGILSDLFSSFSLYFDKPFRIGDFIVIGEHMGTVEKIGIKTTRIKTLQGEELVVSNAELTSTRVQNFKKMSERRITFQFGITYETSHEKIKTVPQIVERIFNDLDGVRLDRVHFATFGDSSLVFEVVYYVGSPDYNKYMDLQQKLNLELLDRLAEVGVEFAYPTQTLYVRGTNS